MSNAELIAEARAHDCDLEREDYRCPMLTRLADALEAVVVREAETRLSFAASENLRAIRPEGAAMRSAEHRLVAVTHCKRKLCKPRFLAHCACGSFRWADTRRDVVALHALHAKGVAARSGR